MNNSTLYIFFVLTILISTIISHMAENNIILLAIGIQAIVHYLYKIQSKIGQ